MNMDHLGPKEQAELEEFMTEMDIKSQQDRLADMSKQCFKACVTNMYHRSLAEEEKKCIKTCSGKYLNTFLRVMERWQEIQTQIQKDQIEQAEEMRQMQEQQIREMEKQQVLV